MYENEVIYYVRDKKSLLSGTHDILVDEHSETEERWLTLGRADNDKLMVVIHTFEESKAGVANIRIVSARLATKHEQRQYEVNL